MRYARVIPCVALLLASFSSASAQVSPTFEVAAIRSNGSDSGNTQIEIQKGGRLVIVNASLKTLVRNAYGLLAFQFTGGPPWFDSERFDINAKTNGTEEITADSLKPLLKSLLEERFHFKSHLELREVPTYGLVVDKSGPKFQPYAGGPQHGMNTRKSPANAQMRGNDVPMSELASNLGNQLGHFVTDETGLQDQYDFVLNWSPDPAAAESTLPSLFTAVKEQLGLRLEPKKGKMEILVIDSVEKPTEN